MYKLALCLVFAISTATWMIVFILCRGLDTHLNADFPFYFSIANMIGVLVSLIWISMAEESP